MRRGGDAVYGSQQGYQSRNRGRGKLFAGFVVHPSRLCCIPGSLYASIRVLLIAFKCSTPRCRNPCLCIVTRLHGTDRRIAAMLGFPHKVLHMYLYSNVVCIVLYLRAKYKIVCEAVFYDPQSSASVSFDPRSQDRPSGPLFAHGLPRGFMRKVFVANSHCPSNRAYSRYDAYSYRQLYHQLYHQLCWL